MASDGPTPRRVPITACDGFMVAMDAMMRRSGQGPHLGGSILELDRPPDAAALRAGWQRFVEDHPLALAQLKRPLPFTLPRWHVPEPFQPDQAPAIELWQETEAPGRYGNEAQSVDSLAALGAQRLNASPHEGDRAPIPNVRLDVIERCDGSAAVLVTWSHLLFDGKGVELLLTELAQRCTATDAPAPTSASPAAAPRANGRRSERIKFIQHFRRIMRTRFTSLGGAAPRPGAAHFHVVRLNAAASAQARQRAAALAGELMPAPFFLACAARAHDRIFQARGLPRGQVVTLPIQTRPKGGAGAIFQNHLAMCFVSLTPSDLASVESATQAIQAQFAETMRHRLDRAFATMHELMRRLPPRLYMAFVRWQARGEVASYFHSHTGPFAAPLTTLAGAAVVGAYHLPTVCTPPGTGLFVSERGDGLDITLSWRGETIDAQERRLMLEQFVADLIGEAGSSEAPLACVLDV